MLEKIERAIGIVQSRDTGNIGYRTQNEYKQTQRTGSQSKLLRDKPKFSQYSFSKYLEIMKTKVDIYDIKHNQIVIIKTIKQMQENLV